MKRLLIAFAAVALGAGVAAAASPKVEKAIKTIQSAGAAKMQQYCDLIDAMDDVEQTAAAEGKAAPAAEGKATAAAADEAAPDPAALEKEIAGLFEELGSDFGAAWDVGDGLDENSADGKEYFAAVDGLTAKCK